jgi:hypothetical protein
MPEAGRGRRPSEGDLQSERMALFELLDVFPAQIREEDLAGRVTRFKPETGFGDIERVNESIAELAGFGLVFRQGGLVIPTLAALHFDLLLEGY